MAITKTKEGKYVADVYVFQMGIRKRNRVSFDTLASAKDYVADATKAKKNKNARNQLGKSTRSIQDMADYYYSLVRYATLRDRSKLRNRQLISHFQKWCDANGIKYSHEFTKECSQRYCSYIFEHWTGKGRQYVFIAAKMLFREELQREDSTIHRNPFPDKTPFNAKQYKPIAIPDDLYKKLRAKMTPLELSIFDIMMSTGCRSGELLSLCWSQVEKESVRFESHAILDKKNNQLIQWESKTGKDREVALNATAKKRFEYLRSLTGNNAYVLPDECRNIRHWITRRFEQVKKKTVAEYPELRGILFPLDKEKNITPKRLRSTFITNLIRVTKDPVLAQKAAGHSSIETTLRHYTDKDFFSIKGGIDAIDLGEESIEELGETNK